MSVTSKTATAAIALMIAAGAYPLASIAQTQTETDAVEVEVIEEGETAGQSASEAGQAIGQAAEETGEAVEQGAEAAGETIVEGAEAAGETVVEGAEATGEAVEQGVSEAGEAADDAGETTVEVIEQDADEADTATVTEEDAGAAGTAAVVEEDAGDTAVIDTEVDQAGADLDDAQVQELQQAEAEGRPVPPTEMIMGIQRDGQWLSSDLIGSDVRNPEGEVVGDIGAILFSDQGPDGVIVEVGGFLGIGEKDVAVKWNELSISEDEIIIQATEEQLKNAPEFLSMEEQRTQAELQAQQELVEEDQGMMTSGSADVVTEEPAAGMQADPAADTTQ